MVKRLGSMMVAVAVMTLAGGGSALGAEDEAVAYTGCLGLEGDLSLVAVGEEPLGPCDKSSQLAWWNQEGIQGAQGDPGPQGAQGEPGAKGEQGEPGTSATYFVSSTYEEPAMVSGVVKCDEGDLVTGGGFRKLAGPVSVVVEDYPSGKRGWTVSMLVADGSLTPISMEVHAVCSDLEPLRE